MSPTSPHPDRRAGQRARTPDERADAAGDRSSVRLADDPVRTPLSHTAPVFDRGSVALAKAREGAQLGARAVVSWARTYVLPPRYPPDSRMTLHADDGVRLAAVELSGPPDAPCTIVLVHGLLNWSRAPRIRAFAELLARDVHVVVPDLRGHGASGGCSTLGLEEPRDVDAAVRAAKVIHPELPVVTVGWSLGGAAALLHAGLFGGVAGAVGLSSPAWSASVDRPGARRVARWAGSPGGRLVLGTLLRTRICAGCPEVPDSGPVVDAISPAFILLVHDPADSYFGPEHPEQIMTWAREPKELWWVPGGGHGTDLLTPGLAGRILEHVRGRLGDSREGREPRAHDRAPAHAHDSAGRVGGGSLGLHAAGRSDGE